MAAPNGNIFAPRASQSAPAASKPQERTRQYKDFLTPALHRRFTSSAGIVLAACWLATILINTNSHIFWSWFPIGIAGLKAVLLLIPCLAVFIVRVANMHIGERAANGPALAALATITHSKSIGNTIHTLGWYMWSGWFFGEVYMWSSKPEDNLGMIDPGRTYERARLNENPIFLRCMFVLLGIIQASRHLVVDYDRVAIPTRVDGAALQKSEQASSQGDTPASLLNKLPQSLQVLAGQLTGIAHRAVKLTVVGILFVTLPVYFLFLRQTAWSWTYVVGRAIYSQLPPSASPTGLLNFGRLTWQAFFGAFLLALLWEFSNATFAVYVAQPPLKKGQPLTNEIKDTRGVLLHRSKDPNGSLITGLKSKREVPRTFAFWELYIICTQFEARRKTLFIEVDRAGGRFAISAYLRSQKLAKGSTASTNMVQASSRLRSHKDQLVMLALPLLVSLKLQIKAFKIGPTCSSSQSRISPRPWDRLRNQ
jgi:nucleoporin NDC1